MRVLLDSHALLWWFTDDDRLPGPARDLLDDPRTSVHVSVASLWKLMAKSLAGRLRLHEDPATLFGASLDDAGFRTVPIERRHVLALAELPSIHLDPFDRMLVAQALIEDLDLVSGDPTFARYPVRVVW